MTLRSAITFADVSIIPAYSDLSSRNDVDLSSDVGYAVLKTPIISSPMDTVTGLEMISAMRHSGGDGVHHRYCDKKVLEGAVVNGYPIAVSPSMGVDFIKELMGYTNKLVCVVDVAHGDSKPALDYAEALVKLGATVVSGNIVIRQAAKRYYDVGVRIFRVGVGSGSSCSTRVVAGVGVPQITAIMDIYASFVDYSERCFIISDGGAHSSGDCVKAFAAGADAVMTGRLLAGAREALGTRKEVDGKLFKEYSGMASAVSLDRAGKERNVEGVSSFVECNGSVATIMDELARGMRAGFAYCGAKNINELRKRSVFIQVTQNGHTEGLPRI